MLLLLSHCYISYYLVISLLLLFKFMEIFLHYRNFGKFAYVHLTILSCFSSVPVCYGDWEGCKFSPLRHNCGFSCQLKVLKMFPGYLHSKDGIVRSWHFLVNLLAHIYIYIFIIGNEFSEMISKYKKLSSKLQPWSKYFENFWCFSNFSFHHKWNEA